jgi:hypothetical protein
VLTEVDRNGNDRKEHGRKEEGAQVFANDISVESQQGDTRIEGTNIGNKRKEGDLMIQPAVISSPKKILFIPIQIKTIQNTVPPFVV